MNNNEQSFVGSTDTLYRLNAGEQLFVWGFRSMAHHYKFGRPTTEDLRQVYRHFGVGDAIGAAGRLLSARDNPDALFGRRRRPGCWRRPELQDRPSGEIRRLNASGRDSARPAASSASHS